MAGVASSEPKKGSTEQETVGRIGEIPPTCGVSSILLSPNARKLWTVAWSQPWLMGAADQLAASMRKLSQNQHLLPRPVLGSEHRLPWMKEEGPRRRVDDQVHLSCGKALRRA